MQRMLTLIITAVMVLATASVHAQDKERKGPPPGEGRPGMAPGQMPLVPPRLAKELELTAEQDAKAKDLDAKFQQERKTWMEANKPDEGLRKEMRDAREAGDEAKQKELRDKMRAHGQPMLEIRKKYMDEFRAALTPEQAAKLDARQKEMRERAGERGGKPAGKPEGKKKE